MKNVKECRDVNRQKVSEQGRDARGAHPLDLIALLQFGRCYGSKVCVMCDDSIPTLFSTTCSLNDLLAMAAYV